MTTKFGLWIDTRSSIDNTLHSSGRKVKKGILLQIEKVPETSDGELTCYVFSFKDALAQPSAIENPWSDGILTIEK